MDGPTIPPNQGHERPIDVTADTPSSSSGSAGGRRTPPAFAAGAVLQDRYRLVAMLGRGGMGEVWRADDLALGIPTALKFHPGSLAMDPLRLARFREEVRLARQIAHPNVCRVHDIAEMPGTAGEPPRVFISMEFVDGEDLQSLLRRIGRLPREKATEVARQICLGLAAAHEQGVIHRDLKPANIMLDGRGRVRLMDFGLAAGGPVSGADVSAGTPIYMAPEQLAGVEASKATDIYALGLVLYELFTGRRAHDIGQRGTIADLRRLHESHSTPRSMIALVGDIDPLAERAILRCLERAPADRPASVLAVAAALPGGDPLAAALAAGETPSPEMIARSGEEGSLRPRDATMLLACLLVLLVIGGLALASGSLVRHVPLPFSTEVLSAKAAEIVRALGYTGAAPHTAAGFSPAWGYTAFIEETDPSPDRWRRLEQGSPVTLVFWYRESPVALTPTSLFDLSVGLADPAPFVAGSVSVMLDPMGRLVGFDAAPPSAFDPDVPAPAPDWSVCLTAAGLKESDLTPATPSRAPWHASDVRAAWTGVHPLDAQVPIRVEAAAEHGQVTSFRVLPPWSRNERMVVGTRTARSIAYQLLDQGVMVSLLVCAIVFSWMSIRAGRGDRRGAIRLAAFVLLVTWLGAALSVEHWYQVFGLRTIRDLMAKALWVAGATWVVYIALEPVIRRHWPTMLVSWTRALDGRLLNPLVGRDLLIGSVVGVGLGALHALVLVAPNLFSDVPIAPRAGSIGWIENARTAMAELLGHSGRSVVVALMSTFFLAGAWRLFQRRWAALASLGALITAFVALEDAPSVSTGFMALTTAAMLVGLLNRFGTLAMAVGYFAHTSMLRVPFTLDLTSWHAASMYAMVAVLLYPAVAGFVIAIKRAPAGGLSATPSPS
ncbi:MAG: serine/threonine-protein kinase [Phycisphaerales bacterium]